MTVEAKILKDDCTVNVTTVSARAGGEVVQCPDGRAGVYHSTFASGDLAALQTEGLVTVAKTTGVLLAGQEVFWDHSANVVGYVAINDKDFFLGTVQNDATSAATTCVVNLNEKCRCVYRASTDPSRTVLTMTTASGAPAGGVIFTHSGGSHVVKFGLAAEAQAADVLSVRSVPVASKWIFQGVLTVVADADADVVDVVLGMADASSTSDPDAITTSAFMHLDLTGSSLDIFGESDNVAAEIAATDTTLNWTVGTPIHFMIDGRSGDGSALLYYVNGTRVLDGTTGTSRALTVAGATGPLKALFLVEKSSNDSPGSVALDDMKIWLTDDAAA